MSEEVKVLFLGLALGLGTAGFLGLAIEPQSLVPWTCFAASAIMLFLVKLIEAFYKER